MQTKIQKNIWTFSQLFSSSGNLQWLHVWKMHARSLAQGSFFCKTRFGNIRPHKIGVTKFDRVPTLFRLAKHSYYHKELFGFSVVPTYGRFHMLKLGASPGVSAVWKKQLHNSASKYTKTSNKNLSHLYCQYHRSLREKAVRKKLQEAS